MNVDLKTDKDFKDRIQREQVRLAMRQLPTTQVASFIVAVVLAYTVRNIAHHGNILAWLLLILMIVASRIVYHFQFTKTLDESFCGERWQQSYVLLAFVSGVFWGLSAFLIFPAGDLGLISLFLLVIGTLSAATTVSHSSIRLASEAWVAPATFLYAVRCFMEDREFGYTLSALIMLYLFAILRYSLNLNKTITSAISLKFENLALLEEVQQGKEVLEKRIEERTIELKRSNDRLTEEIEERRLVTDALRQSEEKYRQLVEYANSIILRWNTNGVITFVNQYALAFFGYTESELLGKNVTDAIFRRISAAGVDLEKMIEDICRNPHAFDTSENEGVRKNGETVWISWSNKPIFSPEGKLVELLSIGQDMTMRKLAEEALQLQEERLRLAMEATQQGWFDLNVQTGEVIVSPEYVKIIGYDPNEFDTSLEDWVEAIHPEDREAVLHAYRECVETGGPRTMEYRRRTKSGEWKWIHSIGKIVGFDADKKPLRMAGAHADISERKRTQEALLESQERFKKLAELLPETIYEMDADGTVSYVNQNALDRFGFSQEDLERGVNGFDMISPEDRPKALENAEKLMRGEKIALNEYKVLRKDGTTFPAIVHTAAKFQDGKPIGFRGVIIDITERKKLEAELRQANKMEAIGTLAGGIAHDFNNILAAIIGFTEMALNDVQDASPTRHYLEQVLKAGSRAKDLVSQILASSRLRGAQDRKPIEIGSVIEEAVKMLRASLPTTIEIHTNIVKDIGIALADPTEVHQVLLNLCTNAAHAMEEKGGSLDISLTGVVIGPETVYKVADLKPGHYLRLTVKDTGHGIDSATMERIFDPYFTTKEVGKGSGLGLAVVQGIVKRHEGAIIVDSEPGVGTSFHVYLPRVENRISQEAKEVERAFPKGTERVLLVDDEEMLIEMGKHVLEWLGYDVTVTTDSAEALELFRAHPDSFDAVITDYTMPHMTGVDLAREMIRIRPDIPIILCTGFSERITEEKARDAGIRAFALKPINMRDLAETIRRVLEEK